MHRNKRALDTGKLAFQTFLGRVDNDLGAFAKQEFLDLDKAVQVALVDAGHVDLVDLALIQENDPVYLTVG